MHPNNKTDRLREQLLTEGVIWKQLVFFSIPIMVGTLFQQLYNMIDAIVVGNFVGITALAAVGGSTQQIIGLILGFFLEVSAGAAVLIAQYYGGRDREKLSNALHTTIAFCIVSGIALSLIGYFLAPVFLRWMNTPEDTMQGAVLYLKIYFCGIIFLLFYNVGAAILRAVGDARKPLYYLIVCCALNTVLDLLLVIVFDLGVFGVAAATVFSQAISALLVLIALLRTDDIYRLSVRRIAICGDSLAKMLRIGIPMGMQALMYSTANIIIQMGLNHLGTDTVAAWTVVSKIDAFYWMVLTCLGICIFRIVWMLIVVPLKPTVEVVTLSHPVSWGVTAVMYIVYWNIKKKKLLEEGD